MAGNGQEARRQRWRLPLPRAVLYFESPLAFCLLPPAYSRLPIAFCPTPLPSRRLLAMTTNTNPIVDIKTPLGTISVEIDAEHAPGTAKNFLDYVDQGAYDGSRFYRTVTPHNQPDDKIRIAVIQGGMASLDDYPRRDAPSIALERTTDTGLKHLDGTISMARLTPDSANSEFFICVGDQPDLDFGGMRNPDGQGFAAFGQVVDGMEVVHAINTSAYEGQHLTPPIEIVSIKRRG